MCSVAVEYWTGHTSEMIEPSARDDYSEDPVAVASHGAGSVFQCNRGEETMYTTKTHPSPRPRIHAPAQRSHKCRFVLGPFGDFGHLERPFVASETKGT